MSMLDFKAYWVNLSQRTDRRAHMEAELKRISLDSERFEALRPSDWRGPEYKIERMKNRTPGAIGCFISQVSCIRKAYDLGKHALVTEDDVIFADDFWDRMKIADEFLKTRSWAIFWLGGTCHTDRTWARENGTVNDMLPTRHPNIVRTYGSFSTHGYVINRAFIPSILEILNRTMNETIGIDYSTIMWVQPVLPCYAFIPGTLTQMDNQSNIGNGITQFSHFKKTMGDYVWIKEKYTTFDTAKFRREYLGNFSPSE